MNAGVIDPPRDEAPGHAADHTRVSGRSPRQFGRFTLASLVIANMVGAGIFTTSGFALADLGTPSRVMWAWLVGAGIAMCGAASYGMLARRMAESGGEYLYLSRTMHPVVGFIAGWVSLLAGFTGAIAFAASAMEAYLMPPQVRPAWLPAGSVAIAGIVIGGTMHGLRARSGAVSQNIAVILKVAVLIAFIVFGMGLLLAGDLPLKSDQVSAAPPFSLTAFAMSLVWISLSYSGFNAAVYVAGEARDAERTVPSALLIGTAIVAVLYLGLNAVFVLAPPVEAVMGAPDVAAIAAREMGGRPLATAARLVIALALFTSVSSMVMAGPRVYARMAEDRLMPRLFVFHDSVPRAAVALQVGLAVLFVLVAGLQSLLSYLGFTLSISAAIAVSALFLVHHREKRRPVASRTYPWAPAIFVIATLGLAALAARENPVELLATVITIVSGSALYLMIVTWRRRTKHGDSAPD